MTTKHNNHHSEAEQLYWDEVSKLALAHCLNRISKRMSKGCTRLAAEIADDMLAERSKRNGRSAQGK